MRYPFIDILRGVAALLVVWYHVIEHGAWTTFPWDPLSRLPRVGWIGVDLFFVISGFVIGKAAMEGCSAGGAWRAIYAERRLRRIVPLYVATLVCYILLTSPGLWMAGWGAVRHILAHLLFLHNLSPATYGSINGPNWSVALEAQFYVLVAFSAPWLVRSSWLRVLLVWVGVALAWRYTTTLVLPPGVSKTFVQQVAATQLPGVLDEFVFGICLAKLAQAGHLDYRPRRMLAWATATVVLLAIAWIIFWPRAIYWIYPGMVVFWRSLLAGGFAALLACVVMCPWRAGWFSRPFRYLGEISYGIYLWHLPILMALLEKTPLRGADLLAATLLSTVLMAMLSWHGFEKLWLKPHQREAARGGQPVPTAPVAEPGTPALASP